MFKLLAVLFDKMYLTTTCSLIGTLNYSSTHKCFYVTCYQHKLLRIANPIYSDPSIAFVLSIDFRIQPRGVLCYSKW